MDTRKYTTYDPDVDDRLDAIPAPTTRRNAVLDDTPATDRTPATWQGWPHCPGCGAFLSYGVAIREWFCDACDEARQEVAA